MNVRDGRFVTRSVTPVTPLELSVETHEGTSNSRPICSGNKVYKCSLPDIDYGRVGPIIE